MAPAAQMALVKLGASQHVRRIKNGAVLVVKVGQRHGMYFICGAQATIKVATPKSEARIRNQKSLEPKVSRHTDSRFDGVVGADSRKDQGLNPLLA